MFIKIWYFIINKFKWTINSSKFILLFLKVNFHATSLLMLLYLELSGAYDFSPDIFFHQYYICRCWFYSSHISTGGFVWDVLVFSMWKYRNIYYRFSNLKVHHCTLYPLHKYDINLKHGKTLGWGKLWMVNTYKAPSSIKVKIQMIDPQRPMSKGKSEWDSALLNHPDVNKFYIQPYNNLWTINCKLGCSILVFFHKFDLNNYITHLNRGTHSGKMLPWNYIEADNIG